MRYLGIDLAWGEGCEQRAANRSGVAALGSAGEVLDAGWTIGIDETVDWVTKWAGVDALILIDAPLVIANAAGQRVCERQVGQRYGAWKVSSNSTNQSSPRTAGVTLRRALEARGWKYDDGTAGPPTSRLVLSECYPYTTIVGVPALGFGVERPPYKRRPRAVPSTAFPEQRARTCDLLIERLGAISHPPLELESHAATAELVHTPSPARPAPAYKQREDLLDAVICAWTAALWHMSGTTSCQVLGADDELLDDMGRRATIIAPARPEQRRDAVT